MFILKLVCCLGGSFLAAIAMELFMNWWQSRPLTEEKSVPLYITKKLDF